MAREIDIFKDFLKKQKKFLLPLDPGYSIELNLDQLPVAEKLNKEYASFVWGLRSAALNKRICTDEKNIIDKYLSTGTYNNKVLEVGCGSGRVTKYLGTKAKKLLAIDYNREVSTSMKKISYPVVSNIFFRAINVLDLDRENFSCILLMENMLGMALHPESRRRIYDKLIGLTKKNGIIIIGIRVRDQLSENKIQIFNYRPRTAYTTHNLYGFSINWTLNDFLGEMEVCSKLTLIEIVPGNKRPSGGTMFHIIFKKN